MLVDKVAVEFCAGDGGNGIVAWRREKGVARGGPDGGDGGKGGDIILRATHNLDTLSSFRYRKVFQAPDGGSGRNKRQTGANGANLELLVPIGTSVIDLSTPKQLFDLRQPDQSFVVARGGRGGFGNVHFASATHQNPFEATRGQPGERRAVTLELAMIAHVALVGEPNAGKSSLLQALTGVEGRIAPFPFSTTEPLLGVMKRARPLILIDLPGLIEGAHRGKGLGDEFLRHTKRVQLIVMIIDATQPDPAATIQNLVSELTSFEVSLADRPRLIVLNKADLISPARLQELQRQFPSAVLVSAKTKSGLENLSSKLEQLCEST